MPFGNLGNLLGDLDFWGGVATGFGEETLRQEERKDKDLRELRNFGMTRGLQIEEENRETLNAAEIQVKELASLIAGDRSANSPEAMEAAYYLIDQEGGIAGANRVAQLLNNEYSTYGIDPITKMGLEPRTTGEIPTARQVAKTFTRLRPLPDIKASGIETRQTALDVIFGGESVEETVSREMQELFATDQETAAALMPVKAIGIEEELILGSNFKDELKRMNVLLNKHYQISPNNRDKSWENTENIIKTNIHMLKEAEKLSKLETMTMTDASRTSLEKSYRSILLEASGLKGEWQYGDYIPQGVQANIIEMAESAVARMGYLVQYARNNGYVGRIDGEDTTYDPLEFVKRFGAAQGYKILLNEGDPENGIDPYLTIDKSDNGKIFNQKIKNTDGWKNSIILGGQTVAPPAVGGGQPQGAPPPATGGSATGASPTSIPPGLIKNVQSNTPSTRKAAARAIMRRIRIANRGLTQPQLENEFKRITGIDWSVDFE